ncbi:MAG: ABC transporter substrate-binding protein [Burkholderiaceae bacterium]
MTKRVSNSRRAFAKSILMLPAAASVNAGVQTSGGNSEPKVLRYAFRVAETGFDPAQVQDFHSSSIMGNIFDAPMAYDFIARPAKIVCNTASALPEVSSNFTTITVRIRPDIYFQDHPAFKGNRRELVAQDYVYSIKRFYNPKFKSPRIYLLENSKLFGLSELRAAALRGSKFDYDREVEGIRALDRYTFQIRLGEPAPRFYMLLADNSFLGAVAREVDEMYDDKQMLANPVGTGPYRLVDWRRSSRMVFEKNPGYRDDIYAEQGTSGDAVAAAISAQMGGRKLPLIDRVEVYIIEENQPRWLAFLNAEHDLVDEIPYDLANLILPNNKLAPNLVKRGIRMDRDYRASVDMALFNMEHPLVGGYSADKVALRRAIGLAYSVDSEIRLVRKNQSMPSESPVSPLTAGYDPTFKSEMSLYSPARAKALLDSFGYVDRNGDGWRELPDGRPLKLEMATQPDQLSRQLDEIWRKCMTAINLNIDFKPAKWPENLKNSRAGKLMMWRLGWVAAQPDGDTFLGLGYGPNKGQANHSRFDLPAFNKLYAQQRTLPDGAERAAAFLAAKKLFVAYTPYKFVGHRIETAVFHPWVVGYRRHSFMRAMWKYVDIDNGVKAERAA